MQFISGDDVPEEIKKAVQEQFDRHEMTITASHHDMLRLFDELKLEHLRTVAGLLNAISRDSGSSIASYLEGVATATAKFKHGLCFQCGSTHEPPQLAEERKPAPSTTQTPAIMQEYNIVEVENAFPQVKCLGCGLFYSSLDDRMLRKPDGCTGCHQQAKWG